METLGLAYADIMAMPATRRVRLIHKKHELEQRRAQKQREDLARARARR